MGGDGFKFTMASLDGRADLRYLRCSRNVVMLVSIKRRTHGLTALKCHLSGKVQTGKYKLNFEEKSLKWNPILYSDMILLSSMHYCY